MRKIDPLVIAEFEARLHWLQRENELLRTSARAEVIKEIASYFDMVAENKVWPVPAIVATYAESFAQTIRAGKAKVK